MGEEIEVIQYHTLCLCDFFLQQSFGIRTAGLEEKATACQMLVCYARELKEGFAAYCEEVVKIMVAHLKFYFHDGLCQVFRWNAEGLPPNPARTFSVCQKVDCANTVIE